MNTTANVQNGTGVSEVNDVGQVRVIETESVLVVTHYLADFERLVNEFTGFAVKAAQATVEMCRVVHDAKTSLAKEDFLKFCDGIGHKTEDSTIRKYLLIGASYDRLIKYAQLLPNSWTSIYAITQLPADVFEALALTGNSMANMTGAQIKALMAPPEPDAEPPSATDAAIPAPHQQMQSTAQSMSMGESVDNAGAAPAAMGAETSHESAELACTSSQFSLSVPTAAVDEQDRSNSTNPSDQVFAMQAVTKVVADAHQAPEAVDAASTALLAPYEIVLRFGSKPTDAALHEMVEMILAIRSKHRIDLKIVSTEVSPA